MKSKLKIASNVLILALLTTSCSSAGSVEAINSLRKQPAKTLQEVMDDSKESMNYGSFSQRAAVKDYKDAFNSVTSDEEAKCTELLRTVLNEYNTGELSIVSKPLYDYLKASVDDLRLSGQKLDKIKKYNGYYFVTANFDTFPNTQGQFTSDAKYVGLDNIMYRVTDGYGNISTEIDGAWVSAISGYLNGKDTATTNAEVPQVETQAEVETQGQEQGEAEGTETAETAQVETVPTEAEVQEVKKAGSKSEDSVYTKNLRQLPYDVDDYESTFGGSTARMAYFPDLNSVYQTVDNEGIVGNGCYNEGINGLVAYEFDRSKLQGTMQITFVFEQDELNKDTMNYIFSYVENYNSGYSEFSDKHQDFLNVPDFVQEQIGIKVEELDRLTNNADIAGMMRKDTIEDAGLAFKLAEYRSSTEINNYTTKVLGVVGRVGNSYLVKAERTVAESPVQTAYVSQYKQIVYYVVRQRDVDFVINDIYTESVELTKQPTIYEISSKYRQLVALNLSGDVPENLQKDITDNVLNKLAEYSTGRVLGEVGGDTGMYSIFDSDSTVLTKERLEYLNSWLRGLLLKRGVDTKATMTIKPVQWISGYDTQVELLTKELIEFNGTGKGIYLENYYVVSNFSNRWVIDDIQNVVQREVEGQELELLKSDFAK